MRFKLALVTALIAASIPAQAQTLAQVLTAIQKRKEIQVVRNQLWGGGGTESLKSADSANLIHWEGVANLYPGDADINGLSFESQLKLINQACAEVYLDFSDSRKISSGTGLLEGISPADFYERATPENYHVILKRLAGHVQRCNLIIWPTYDWQTVKYFSSHPPDGDSGAFPPPTLGASGGDASYDTYDLTTTMSWGGGGGIHTEPYADPPVDPTQTYSWASFVERQNTALKMDAPSSFAGSMLAFTSFYYNINQLSGLDASFKQAGNRKVAEVNVGADTAANLLLPDTFRDNIASLSVSGSWAAYDLQGGGEDGDEPDGFIDYMYYIPSYSNQDNPGLWEAIYDDTKTDASEAWSRFWEVNGAIFAESGNTYGDYVSFPFTYAFSATLPADFSQAAPLPEKAPKLRVVPDFGKRQLQVSLAVTPGNDCKLVWNLPSIWIDKVNKSVPNSPSRGLYAGGGALAARRVLNVVGVGDWDAVFSGKTDDREPEVAWQGGPFAQYRHWGNFFAYVKDYWQPVLKQVVCSTYGVNIAQVSATSYQIKFYRKDQVGSKNGATGEYSFSGNALETYTITTPSQDESGAGVLQITTNGGVTYDLVLTETKASDGYIDSQFDFSEKAGPQTFLEKTVKLTAARSGTNFYYYSDPYKVEDQTKVDGRSLPKVTTTYYDGGANPWRLQQIKEEGTEGIRTTTYTYQWETIAGGLNTIDHLSSITQTGGPNPYSATYDAAEQLTHYEQGSWIIDVTYAGQIVTRKTKFNGTIVCTETTTYSPDMTTATTVVTGATDTQRVVEYYPGTDTVNPWGLKRVRDFDGSLATWDYSWTGGNFLVKESRAGNSAVNAATMTAGTRTETTVNAAGWMTTREVYSIEGNAKLDFATGTGTPFPTSFSRPLGATESFIYDGQGRVTSHTDQWGKTTTYPGRDGLGRVTQVVRSPVTWDIAYNPSTLAAGNLGYKITATAAGATTRTWTEQASPFGASASLAITGPENITVTCADNGATVTTTKANDTTKRTVTTAVTKGTLATAITGNATEPWNTTYAFSGAGGWTATTTHASTSALTGNATYDGLGRIKQQVIPGYNGTGTATTSFAYTGGLLSSTTGLGGATTYGYRPDGALKTVAFGGRSLTCDRVNSTASQITWQWTNGAGDVLLKRIYTAASGVTEDSPWGDDTRKVTTTPALSAGVLTQAISGATGTGISGSGTWTDGVPTAGSFTQGAFTQGWTATPNAFGAVTSVTVKPGGTTANQFTASYSELGLPTGISAVAGLGAVTFNSTPFDGSGNLTLSATRSSKTASEAYSAKGYLTSASGYGEVGSTWSAPILGSTITWPFSNGALSQNLKQNSIGGLTGRQFADSSTESFGYTSGGLLNGWTRPGGAVTTAANAFGQFTSLGVANPIAYDNAGRMSSATDAAGTHRRTYDKGQLDVETHSGGPLAGQSVDRDYDKGRVTKVKLSGGETIQYTYDPTNGELTGITTAGGLSGTWSNFDAVTGKAKTLTIGSVLSVSSTYDSLGRVLTRTSTPSQGSAQGYTYGYNADGQCTTWNTPGGNWTTLSYSASGWLNNATRAGGPAIVYGADAQGRPTGITWNGAAQTTGVSDYRPTSRANRSTVEVAGSVSTSPLAAVTINGTTVTVNSTTGLFSQTYTPAANSWQTYTVRGTITGAGYGGANAVAEEVRQVFIPPANESLATNTNGARTGDTRWTYTVNGIDQLTSALESNPAPGTQALQLDFKYDWQGRMVERKATRAGAAVKRTTFLYDGWRPVRETEFDSTGRLAAQRVYTWGPDLSGSLEGVEGVGGLIEVLEKKGTTTTKSLAISDKANVTGLVDGSTGALVASYACAPYGEPLSATGERAGSCPFRFQSKYWDEDLRLYYFGKRWYDPATRTFLSRDPMRETGDGPNDMAAFRNQPLNYIDPLGGKSIEMIGDELRKAQDENGFAGIVGATPDAIWDFLNPFDPSSPATEARHKFSGEALPQALTNLDAMSIPSPLKTFIKANIGFGLAGNAVNPLNMGVDLYDTGVTVNKIGFAATGKGIVDGIREQPAIFAGGLPVMLFTGRVAPRVPVIGAFSNEANSLVSVANVETSFWSRVEFNGTRVYQRDDLIDAALVDARGRTNFERMQSGLAPIGPDGKSINLHHLLQTNDSPLAEVTATFHHQNSSIVHINPNTIPSGIDRSLFDVFRSDYWINRATDFSP